MASPTDAHERIMKLLSDPPAEPVITDGYLDLLEDLREAPQPSLAQSVMESSLLPKIYEDLWRPIGFNLAKGWPLGPSTAEEFTLAREWLGLGQPDGADRRPGAAVLDVACGPGNVTRGLHAGVSADGMVTGIDMSPSMLARAVRDTNADNARNVGYVRGDALDLPFRDAEFDAVCCFGAMYLFSDPWAALDSMTRVLRPGGRIVILTSRRPRLPLSRLADLAGRTIGMSMFGDEEMTRELSRRGFVNLQRRGYPLLQMVGARLSR